MKNKFCTPLKTAPKDAVFYSLSVYFTIFLFLAVNFGIKLSYYSNRTEI